jgi:Cu-processing system permease protein
MGTLSFTGDKGAAELLFAQPVSRGEVLVGKVLGIFCSIALSMLAGFTVAGAIVAGTHGTEGLTRYGAFVLLSMMLSLVFLSISALVSIASKRKGKAFGISLFLWFFFVIFYDLLALGVTLMLKGAPANLFLFVSLFGNPVDMVRIASLIVLDNVTIFGAAGAALLRFLGGGPMSVLLLVGGLALWITVPLVVSHRLIIRQDL